uniref:Uncharacterized protein n=1 Tax=Arundo donax TaxID=35708 RepID=A0A0A9FS87_ARUDO
MERRISTVILQIHVCRVQFQQFGQQFGLTVGCSIVNGKCIIQGNCRLLQEHVDKVNIIRVQGLEDVPNPLLMLRVLNDIL